MTDKELERLLKESKPMVKDDYGFMLEVIRRTSAIKGVKSEVDRQRKQWHKALRVTFFIGIAAGILIYAITLFLKSTASWHSRIPGYIISSRHLRLP